MTCANAHVRAKAADEVCSVSAIAINSEECIPSVSRFDHRVALHPHLTN